ncbi:MAG TPA: 6-carboxytetrahydropterin synthase [Gemmatimonadales bacterium]|nr:6-carboxytetrahydropterin synthase [Gemmatimonadales bacterium]
MPIAAVSRRVHFNAAHRLHNPARSDEWNRRTFGPCNNPNGHGHNYELELTVEGPVDPETGYVIDVGILKDLAERHVVARLDHKHLNLDVDWFRDLLPSAEHIAMMAWRELRPHLPAELALRVRLWETPRNWVDYDGR